MTGILPTPVTLGSATPTTVLDIPVCTMLLTQVNIVPVKPASELLISEPIAEVPMQQPGVDSQIGGTYIATTQA